MQSQIAKWRKVKAKGGNLAPSPQMTPLRALPPIDMMCGNKYVSNFTFPASCWSVVPLPKIKSPIYADYATTLAHYTRASEYSISFYYGFHLLDDPWWVRSVIDDPWYLL